MASRQATSFVEGASCLSLGWSGWTSSLRAVARLQGHVGGACLLLGGPVEVSDVAAVDCDAVVCSVN